MNTLSIIGLVVAAIWIIADIIFFVTISEMRVDAENDLKKATAIRLDNERELAHIYARKEALENKEERIIADDNIVKRKWADLEKAQKEYATALAKLEDREVALLDKQTILGAMESELNKKAELLAEREQKAVEMEPVKKARKK